MQKSPITDIPRIDINRTVTNDICTILNVLVPTKDIARLIRNYDTFIFDYLAEMRLLSQIINRSISAASNPDLLAAPPVKNNPEKKKFRKISWLSNKGSLLR